METKRKIMQAAFKLFAHCGNDFSLNEIALEVGIKKASIYFYYESKEKLLYNVIEDEIEAYFIRINEEIDSFSEQNMSIDEILKKSFLTILNYYDSKEKLYFWKRLLLLPPKGFDPGLIGKVHEFSEARYEMIRNTLKKGMEDGIIRPQSEQDIVISYFAMIHGVLSSILIYDSYDIMEHCEVVWGNFWNGIFRGGKENC